jgi:hypothetical protein
VRPKEHNGGGGISVPKAMLDLFPLADGKRPTAANGYVDTSFLKREIHVFYRTFAFSGSKWGIKTNANKTHSFTGGDQVQRNSCLLCEAIKQQVLQSFVKCQTLLQIQLLWHFQVPISLNTVMQNFC